MPSPLQKSPYGMLAAFALKTIGRQPTSYSDTVLPTSESTDFYTLDLLTVSTNSGNVQLTTDSVTLPVPAAQTWRVKALGWAVNSAAADVVGMYSYLKLNNVTQYLGGQTWRTSAGAENHVGSLIFTPPLVLPSGAILGVAPGFALGAARNLTVTVLYDLLAT